MTQDTELWRQACATVCYPAFYTGMALAFAPSAIFGAWAMDYIGKRRARRTSAPHRVESFQLWKQDTHAVKTEAPCYYCGEAHKRRDCPLERS